MIRAEKTATVSIEQLAEKHSAQFPGYDLVSFFEAAFPVYRVTLRTSLLQERDVPILQEYILKMLEAGLSSPSEIAGWLGLPDAAVHAGAADLLRGDHVLQVPGAPGQLQLTGKGRKALETLKLLLPQVISLTFDMDAITGTLEPRASGLVKRDTIRKMGLTPIPPSRPQPSLENVEFLAVKNLVRALRESRPEKGPAGDLIDVLEVERVYTEYRRMQVLVYQEVAGPNFDFLVMDRRHRMQDHEQALKRMERNGIRVVPGEAHSEVREQPDSCLPSTDLEQARKSAAALAELRLAEQQITQRLEAVRTEQDDALTAEDAVEAQTRVAELEERLRALEEQKAQLLMESRTLATYEHRPLLEKALDEANESVIIVSPWLRRSGLDEDLMSRIEAALNRHVHIYIGYGITTEDNPANDRPQHDSSVVERLQKLQYDYPDQLSLTEFGNTHEKILVCDRRFFVVTSFNWLSFRGDPRRPLRQERGMYCAIPEQVDSFYVEQMTRFQGEQIMPAREEQG